MDIKAAFDTIHQDKMLSVIEGLMDKVSLLGQRPVSRIFA
jgi:hypothetical protein